MTSPPSHHAPPKAAELYALPRKARIAGRRGFCFNNGKEKE
jgi:hypothetical protein